MQQPESYFFKGATAVAVLLLHTLKYGILEHEDFRNRSKLRLLTVVFQLIMNMAKSESHTGNGALPGILRSELILFTRQNEYISGETSPVVTTFYVPDEDDEHISIRWIRHNILLDAHASGPPLVELRMHFMSDQWRVQVLTRKGVENEFGPIEALLTVQPEPDFKTAFLEMWPWLLSKLAETFTSETNLASHIDLSA